MKKRLGINLTGSVHGEKTVKSMAYGDAIRT